LHKLKDRNNSVVVGIITALPQNGGLP
jgi:hypothetical protein